VKKKVHDKLSAFAAGLQADAEAMLLEHVDALLAGVRERAIAGLREAIAAGGNSVREPEDVVRRDVEPANAPATPKKRACTKCREPGHRAPQCPNGDATEDDDESPPASLEAARAARREAIANRVAPPAATSTSFDPDEDRREEVADLNWLHMVRR
jgi:hypothetical protein